MNCIELWFKRFKYKNSQKVQRTHQELNKLYRNTQRISQNNVEEKYQIQHHKLYFLKNQFNLNKLLKKNKKNYVCLKSS